MQDEERSLCKSFAHSIGVDLFFLLNKEILLNLRFAAWCSEPTKTEKLYAGV